MAVRLSIELPRRRDAPQLARRALDVFSDEVHPTRLYDARLLVTELVATALEAGGTSPLRIEATYEAPILHTHVMDTGEGFVRETHGLAALEEASWDLHLVAELADRWGTDDRRSVWFELDLTREADAKEPAVFLRPRGASE
jgi:hypothetical protein